MLKLRWSIGAVLIVAASAMFAQTPKPAPAKPMDCMMMSQEMQKTMKAADDRLQSLVKQMNDAQGPARTEAMIAVVNELVAQHQTMREHMSGMQMGSEGMHDMKDCPMMQSKEKAATSPHQH